MDLSNPHLACCNYRAAIEDACWVCYCVYINLRVG